MKHPSTARNAVPITDELVDAVAEEAVVDRRSVLRRLAGLEVRGNAGRRLDRVLARRRMVLARATGAE